MTFTQNGILQPGRSYSTLNVTVNVNKRAPRLVTTTASVSGGGAASGTVTNTVMNFPSWLSYKSFSGSGWSYNRPLAKVLTDALNDL